MILFLVISSFHFTHSMVEMVGWHEIDSCIWCDDAASSKRPTPNLAVSPSHHASHRNIGKKKNMKKEAKNNVSSHHFALSLFTKSDTNFNFGALKPLSRYRYQAKKLEENVASEMRMHDTGLVVWSSEEKIGTQKATTIRLISTRFLVALVMAAAAASFAILTRKQLVGKLHQLRSSVFLGALRCCDAVVSRFPVPAIRSKMKCLKLMKQDRLKWKNWILLWLCCHELMLPVLGAVCSVTDGSAANGVACTCGNEECTSTTGLICYSTLGGGSCRKMGLGPFGYTKEEGNTNCGSMSNRYPILNKAACEAAAKSMDLDDVVASEGGHSVWPPGCLWGGKPLGLFYNNLVTSTSSCNGALALHRSNSEYCLCVAAYDCTHTNGATTNTADCLCGGMGVVCTAAASGLYCDSSFSVSVCGTAPITACAKTDGSSASSVTCVCGNVACSASTGFICYVGLGASGGSCRKTGFGPFGYIKEDGSQTKCVSVSNRKPILDKATCEAAAASMGLEIVVAEEVSYSSFPPGCSGSSLSSLYYNTLFTSTTSCTSRRCLCIAAPDCTQTNGVTSNTNACVCGGMGVVCLPASGLYCTSSTSTCSSGDLCTSVDGSSLNTGVDCACGTAGACNSFNGMYCYASNNQCSFVAIPDCLTTDGSAANGAACTCSSETCTSTTGLICYSTLGGGSCRKTDVGPFGYPKVVTNCGSMSSMSNRNPILDKAACEAAATSMGLDVVVAVEVSSSSHPPGCYWSSEYIYTHSNNPLIYNTLSTSTASCTSHTRFCLCVAAPDCTHSNGATLNTAICMCGGTGVACTAASGLFCFAAFNYCSEECSTCGGELTYSLVNSGMCADVSGRLLIGSKIWCEEAAVRLDLASKDAQVEHSLSIPGCRENTGSSLKFNSNLASTNPCQIGYPCICGTGPFCTEIDGTMPNSAECICGTTACFNTTGLFCHGAESLCSNSTIFYSVVESGRCDDVSGRGIIGDKAMCEEAAVSLSLSDTSADASSGAQNGFSYIPGCYLYLMNPGSLYFNTEITSLKDCSYASSSYKNKCICVTAPLCSEHNGTTPNNAACYCGTKLCREVSTGLYCISSLNVCARACPLGKYRSAATDGICIKCKVGQHSDDATDNTRCKLW